ncbi:hypothetical protein [Luteibacter sp. UNC138MFCol5.1]|uniref:hypothetical protein n=1 Tax=Luteibacter sp. UNC138MFCol5.1 TaxID=1502774 RepID=UPI000B7C720C|nr:hypothetical protein [Luteibacter sp. UNC138MFCol5.1]
MNQVIVFPRGQLSAEDKASMREMGIAVVEADDPSKVVTVIPVAPSAPVANPDDLTMALLHGLSVSNWDEPKVLFVKELHRRMLAREKTKAVQS